MPPTCLRINALIFHYKGAEVATLVRSTEEAARIDDQALREAQRAKDAVRAYEIVYAALGAPASE